MTEPSKLAEKAMGKLNATWNSVKQLALESLLFSFHTRVILLCLQSSEIL